MKSRHPVCLVAVDIRSTHNVGSLFRTCDGFDVELVLVGISPYPACKNDTRLPHIVNKVHNAIHKTALGAEETVKWWRTESLSQAVEVLRKRGFTIYALEQDARSEDIAKINLTAPTAIVVGREVTGLTQEERELCERIYEIPMKGKKESFNVSVSAGIALYRMTE